MNHIFLDIDGVLNSPSDDIVINRMFEEKKLKLFIDLVKETNSKIVIISSRRHYEDEINLILDTFKNEPFFEDIYFLPETKGLRRNKEINNFIHKYHIENYVVLDDIDDGNRALFKERFIHINGLYGLRKEDIKRIKEIL